MFPVAVDIFLELAYTNYLGGHNHNDAKQTNDT